MTSSNQGVLVEFQRSEILTQASSELIIFLFKAVVCTDLILVDLIIRQQQKSFLCKMVWGTEDEGTASTIVSFFLNWLGLPS